MLQGVTMDFDQLTDEEIRQLLAFPKSVTSARIKWKEKPGHKQKNYHLDGGGYSFDLYLRQNNNDPDDFSCGLSVIRPSGSPLTLCRYNGRSHVHHDIRYQCHIHSATGSAVRIGRKPESFAAATDRYRTLDGALYCIVNDCSIKGIPDIKPDEPDLFSP